MKKLFYVIVGISMVAFSCKKSEKPENETIERQPLKLGFEVANMDTTVRPQDNLDEYVNGVWKQNNPVPSSETRWGSFSEILEYNRSFLKDILEKAASGKFEKGSNMQKIGDFYAVAMDSAKLNQQGVSPIMPLAKRIDKLDSKEALPQLMSDLIMVRVGGFFRFYVYIDKKDSEVMIPYLGQGGIGLPDVDFYKNDRYAGIRKQYTAHISNMLSFLDVENPEDAAQNILDLETKLAYNSMTRVQRRNPDTTYNKISREQLQTLSKAFDFEQYFKGIGIGEFDSLIVSQPEFIRKLSEVIQNSSLETIQNYLKWNLINGYSSYLSDEIDQESFNFYAGTLRGAKEQKPRWKRAISTTDRKLGELLGQEYVKEAFSPEAKEKVYEMVGHLQEAFEDRLNKLTWMGPETKVKALEKLNAFTRKLGYPDKWKDYSDLQIERDSYAQNVMRANEWSLKYNLNKLGKPVDKTEWGMTPSTVNAYYSPLKNEIVFPAGIMQPPFFDPEADDAVNYGGIGAVIGHELSHGFDDQGSKYDAQGNLKSWWTKEDREKFDQRTKALANQFSSYTVFDTLNVNGQLTLGENIADLGGITMAYYAYQKYLDENGRDTLRGFTPEQRFFIGWAQVWRTNFTDEELKQRLITDVHSPGPFRANGAPSNMTEFYEAFNVQPGDKMYREKENRVSIW